MTKSVLSSTAFALVLATPLLAAGQQAPGGASCPPGSWFCAEAPQQHASPAGKPVPLEPLPEPDDAAVPPAPPPFTPHESPAKTPPPEVVYQPPPPVVVVRPEAPPLYEYEPMYHAPFSRRREWGLNLHFEGATFGGGAHHDAGMGGAGAGLRFKPTRSFGLEADVDFLGGRDYQGQNRSETAFAMNALVFVNPQSRAQLYLLAGFGWSGAHVTSDGAFCASYGSCTSLDTHYTYFGGQFGGGLELRLSRVLAFNADVRGFIRGRTDSAAQAQPEFVGVDSFGNARSTNTSGGALFTGGMTLYF
ncbi:MAG: porin family protein [Myxococcota bacterium]|nr:porin family protein [Myxococcota bacterium]